MENTSKLRYNRITISSLSAFARIRGGVFPDFRDVYFVRACGADADYEKNILTMDEILNEGMRRGDLLYRRLSSLPLLSSADAEKYSACYDRWMDSFRERVSTAFTGSNFDLEEALGSAVQTVLELYMLEKKALTHSMEKNFFVKLLFWFDSVIGRDMQDWNARSFWKIVISDVVKEQDYLFLYLLTLLGADVLLLNPSEDVRASEKLLALSASFQAGGLRKVQIPAYDPERLPRKVQAVPPRQEAARASGPASGRTAGSSSAPQQSGSTGARPSGTAPGQASPAPQGPVVVHLPPHPGRRRSGSSAASGAAVGRQDPSRTSSGQKASSPQRSASSQGKNTAPARQSTASGAAGAGSSGLTSAPKKASSRRMEKSYEELASLASSVVMIAVHDHRGIIRGTGSGIMIGKAGYILTNHHVVKNGVSFSVQLENDSAVYQTREIIKYNSVLDMAVLRIGKTLTPLPLYKGREKLVRGQQVVAIGSPLGLFNSVSNGIISGFRTVGEKDMIQFTAPISPGSSGGALLNLYGEVIGICTAGFDNGQNLNLAVGYENIAMFIQGFV